MTVGEVLKPAARALGLEVGSLLEELIAWSKPPRGGDTNPAAESMRRYASQLKRRCSFRFAELLADYLVTRKAVNDAGARTEAVKLCDQVLVEHLDDRYGRGVGSDPSSEEAHKIYVGAYAICRKETGDERYHQELLLLERKGDKEPRNYATYVTDSLVGRGSWSLVGEAACAKMTGYRDDPEDPRRHDIADIFLTPDQANARLMGGFLAGIATRTGLPVVMPLVAVRIGPPSDRLVNLAHGNDSTVRATFGNVFGEVGNVMDERYKKALDQIETIFPAGVLPKGAIPKLLSENNIAAADLLMAELARLCLERSVSKAGRRRRSKGVPLRR